MADLFSQDPVETVTARVPLAARMRPRDVSEFVGQRHVLAAGTPLGQLLRPTPQVNGGERSAVRSSLILWGPPGTGKTTLATLVASASGDHFEELSAVTAGIKDVRAVIDGARHRQSVTGVSTVLFIDEVHRFSKTQQDALLPAVENGWVRLVAATTENPSFAVIAPLLSRSLLVPLRSVADDEVAQVIARAIVDPRGLNGAVVVEPDAISQIVRMAGGDVRRALTILEAAAASADHPADGAGSGAGDEQLAAGDGPAPAVVTSEQVAQAVAHAVPRYDRDGDQHYDVTSALIKSVRGSDVDAALHYLARMIVAGEDPRFIARRLVILASEDIGMADPTALQTAMAAMQAVSVIGMPEARITLAHAVVHLSLAPKSNRVYAAIGEAIADVENGLIGAIPPELRDSSTASARSEGAGEGYQYPHNDVNGIAAFDYAPVEVRGRRYYQPTTHGAERRWGEVAENIHNALGRDYSAG